MTNHCHLSVQQTPLLDSRAEFLLLDGHGVVERGVPYFGTGRGAQPFTADAIRGSSSNSIVAQSVVLGFCGGFAIGYRNAIRELRSAPVTLVAADGYVPYKSGTRYLRAPMQA